ncbi:MAG: hypothetical protein COA65_02350 [Rhodospirillaceae bacterium]|nr:MAG: hypothetical protein COA65_02350 [Rhodospirillaceae bacterium]
MPITTVDQLRTRFRSFGIDTVYIKHLSAKQDNEKNQIYLGGGLDGVTNLFPATIDVRSPSESTLKRQSKSGKPKLEAKIDFAWMGSGGELFPAPNTRIIDYFQYPEVRMSGFLSDCKDAPDALRRRLQAQFGKRILALGVAPSGQVLGCVLTERDDPIVTDFPELPELAAAPILRVLVVDGPAGASPLDLLMADLSRIVSAGWHSSRILRPASPVPSPFRGAQGAGYTLEALLGVPANAKKGPDKYGFEVKSYGGSRISLMTPTPDGGFQGDHSFREFMERYGRPGQKGDGSTRFTGIHRCGIKNEKTGMLLRVTGYNPETGKFDGDTDGIAVELVLQPAGDVVASWSLAHLANSWNSKHASAAYVPSSRQAAPGGAVHDVEYKFGPAVIVGQGTDVWKLLKAIHSGVVYYDPADSIYADGKAKVRPQWRINTSRLKETLGPLYNIVNEFQL